MKRKNRNNFKIIAFSVFLLSVVSGKDTFVTAKDSVIPETSQITTHAPIDIDGDADLDAFPNKTGSGTYEDPYIIENYLIDGDYDNVPIKIQHTSKYLIIQNCEIIRGNVDYAGISICNSSHVTIANNIIEYCLNSGIKIEKALYEDRPTDFHIKDNIIQNNSDNGISIYAINYIEISNNEISYNEDNGIDLDYVYGINNISNNLIKLNGAYGIYCKHNTSASIYSNTVENNNIGISIWISSVEIYSNNISYNNQEGLRVSGDYCQIWDNLILSNGGDGIILSSLTRLINYCSVYSNKIYYNDRDGIEIEGSYNDIYSNEFIGNSTSHYFAVYGVDISDSKSLRNNISDNSICGFDEMVNDEGTETLIEGNFCPDESDSDLQDEGIPGFSSRMLFISLGIGICGLFKHTRNNIR